MSGVPRDDIEKAARIAARSERTHRVLGDGPDATHKHAVATIQEVASFMLLRGNVGRPGAGLCPVRGHSNVQGDRTMGIWEQMPDAFLDRLGREHGFEPPRAHGFDTIAAIEAMRAGDVKVFFAMGGNFVSASPDTVRTAEGLERCRLTVHVSTKLNRSHVVTGARALILPLPRPQRARRAGRRGPQYVTVENSMAFVSKSEGKNTPASEALMSEPAIVAGLAKAALGVSWDASIADYERIRESIARVVDGCDDYPARVRAGGFHMRNAARERDFAGVPGGRARFTVHPLTEVAVGDGELLLTTIRSHDQFNTTIYTQNDRYRGIEGDRRVVFMNEGDVKRLGLAAGDKVDVVSPRGARGGVRRRPVLDSGRVRRGVLPRDEPARAARQLRRQESHAHVEVGPRPRRQGVTRALPPRCEPKHPR